MEIDQEAEWDILGIDNHESWVAEKYLARATQETFRELRKL